MQMWESLALPLVSICQKKIEGCENMVQAPPKPVGPEVNIELEDLKELARINPLAWEQLLHIVDNRQKDAKIADLQAHLEQAHKYGETREKVLESASSNGKSHVA